MAVKRMTYKLQNGRVIDVVEVHEMNYGAKGKNRKKKQKATREEVEKVNHLNKVRRCRQRLLEYFKPGDLWVTLTYRVKDRPEDMKRAIKDFFNFRDKVKRRYDKRGKELFWIRNIEQGTKGAWHIHLVINNIGDTASIIQECWKKGSISIETIRLDETEDADFNDFTRLANYLTKDEHTRKKKEDGSCEKPRIKEASYGSSKNMPLPEPKTERLKRWKQRPEPKKGYYIAKVYTGINPATHFEYRRYTMFREGGKGNVFKTDGFQETFKTGIQERSRTYNPKNR